MFAKNLSFALVIAASTLAFSGIATAQAQEGADYDMKQLFKMEMMDRNKDGMVSKKEFMAMMDKAYDMKAKAMGAKGGMMTEAQMKEFFKSLYGPG